jgi:hypothetical protein
MKRSALKYHVPPPNMPIMLIISVIRICKVLIITSNTRMQAWVKFDPISIHLRAHQVIAYCLLISKPIK